MSNTLIERVAAILNTTPDEFGSEYIARMILETLREPTDAMVQAGVDADHTLEAIEGCPEYPESCANIYRAMIDAALNEQASD